MADILIRGMAMPKYTTKAEFGIDADGNPLCMVYHEDGTEPDIYDAVPLPEGHGRLCDLDALKADIEGFIECMTNSGAVVDGEMLWGKLLDALDNAKTIIPAEGGTDDGD